jgi:hypothetical protein
MVHLLWTKIAQLQVVFMEVSSKYKQQLQLHKVLGKLGLVTLYKQLKTKAISTWNVPIKVYATVEVANVNVSMVTVALIVVQPVAQMIVVVMADV